MGEIFNARIPKKLRLPLLIFALFPHLMVLSMFNMNSTFTASFLDLEVDDLQFMFSLAYALIVCSLFINTRFFSFFNIRNYLLIMTLLSSVVLLGMTLTSNTQLMYILRCIQGPLTLFEGCILLPIIMSQLRDKYAKIVAYSILYCFIMTSDKFTTSLIKFAIEGYHHNAILYAILGFHILVLLIYLVLFNHNRMFPKKPLYQLNLSGIVLFSIGLISGAYFLVYGRKLYWFESEKIVLAFACWSLFSGLFILYQRTTKRPLFHFEVFKSKKVLVSLLLFFVFYVMRASMGNVYQVMGTVWGWPWTNVLALQYYGVAGTVVGVIIAAVLMMKNVRYYVIFGIGFLVMSVSMWWFGYLFYPDVSPASISYPLVLEGVGQGVLFTPIVLYLFGSVTVNFAGSISLTGTAMRFWSSTIGYAIMQNLTFNLITKQQTHLSSSFDVTSTVFQSQWDAALFKASSTHVTAEATQLAATSFNNELINQSLLLANIDIFHALFWLGITVSLLCFLFRPLFALYGSLATKLK